MSRKKFWLFPFRKPDRKCSFMAIFVGHLGFLPNDGGNVKPCMINSYVMSIVSIEVSHESRHIGHYFDVSFIKIYTY